MTDSSSASSAERRLAVLFPDSGGDAQVPWWKRRRGLAAIGAVVAGLLVIGLVATDAFGASGGSYRTAAVQIHGVDSVLTGVATIEPVAQATLAFPVAGTVASVNVNLGDQVAAGGTLASLDTQALTETLHTKEAALAQAQLTLSKALSGQSVGGLSSGAGGSSSSSGAAASLSAARSNTATGTIVLTAFTTDPALAAAQQAVVTGQHNVDAALTAAANALNSATSVCASFTDPAPTTTTTPPSTPDATACQAAINDVLTAQNAVSNAQHTLASASSALDALLAQRAATPPTTTPDQPSSGSGNGGSRGSGSTGATGATGATGDAGSTGASGSGSTGSGANSGSTRSGNTSSSSPSSADLIAYQSTVDADTAAVAVAQQNVEQATITSPLAGTVVAVNLAIGETVTAGSSTGNVVVEGTGGYEVSTTVSVANIPAVSVGQASTVLPDGTHHDLAGKVVSISVMPVTASTSSTLYRVVVGLDQPNAQLENGATGTVSIVTKQARAALAVPTSAITSRGNRHVVSVVSGSGVTVVPVQVGVVGSTWTEIKSGVTKGEHVVLADVSAALPGSATATPNSTTTGVGGIGGSGGAGSGNFSGGTARTR
jgi:multidrug efflux pump subunit AcrA (membrane-fusion protein)